MSTFKELCEMDISSLVQGMLSPDTTTNVGNFGKMSGCPAKNIIIKPCDCGGVEVMSQDLNIKLSKEVFEAIKAHIMQGENNG